MSDLLKWVPAVDPILCNGCGACIEACEPQCLELDGNIVSLTRPDPCMSDEHCVSACAVDAIRMEWSPVVGEQTRGRWQP